MDNLQYMVEICQQALTVAIELSLPVLLVSLVVGLVVSVLQAATQIQEQTLASIPKMLAIAGSLLLLMPWLLSFIAKYTISCFTRISEVGI